MEAFYFTIQHLIADEEIHFGNSDTSEAAAVCSETHVSGMQLTALVIHELVHSNMIAGEICFRPHTSRGVLFLCVRRLAVNY